MQTNEVRITWFRGRIINVLSAFCWSFLDKETLNDVDMYIKNYLAEINILKISLHKYQNIKEWIIFSTKCYLTSSHHHANK